MTKPIQGDINIISSNRKWKVLKQHSLKALRIFDYFTDALGYAVNVANLNDTIIVHHIDGSVYYCLRKYR